MRVLVLADTHAPRRWKSCPPAVAALLSRADRILHAGDVCTVEVLEELQRFAPVTVVMGNNDRPEVAAWGASETALLDLDGVAVAMIHDAGPARGRADRMRRRFPDAQLVIFGHSHIPLEESADDFRIFNPGSPTDRRRQPHATVGELTIRAGSLVSVRVIPVT